MRAICHAFLIVVALVGPAAAQAPELMVLIDGSRHMSDAVGPEPIRCAPQGTARPAAGVVYAPDTALNLVKEALVGTVRGPRWCVTQTPADRAAHRLGPDGGAPHHRAMCCHDAACGRFGPCGEDHDSAAVEAAAAQVDVAWAQDGLLTRFADSIKVSMLFTDGNLAIDGGAAGHYSFGPVVQGQNLGARGPGDFTGGLIDAHRGRDGDPAAAVDDSAAEIRAHSAFVAHAVRRLVPFGEAPLAALIDDARLAAAAPDAERACRPRAAVLITRGVPMVSPYGAAPEVAARFHAETGMPLHVIVLDPLEDGPAHRWARAVAAAGAPDMRDPVVRATDAAQVRRALAGIASGLLDRRDQATQPLITAPSPADVCPPANLACQRAPDAVLQWRMAGFASGEGADRVGHLHAEALRCQAGPRPTAAEQVRFEEVLAARVSPRRSLWRPDGILATLTGGVGACFDPVGRATCALPSIDPPLGIQGAPPADQRPGLVIDPPPRRRAGLLVNGHFGADGLGPEGVRRLGALGQGDLVALRPPALEVASAAYLAYRERMEARPTLIAGAADDGLVHLFRARDGVEVVAFAPTSTLPELQTGRASAQGPLDVGDMLLCRTIGGGGAADCPSDPADWRFATLLTGATARGIFGLDLTDADGLAREIDRALDPAQGFGLAGGWEHDRASARDPGLPAASTLGETRGRPALVHVRHAAGATRRIRAAVVVGCGAATGDDPTAGRCVLVLDASSGEVIRRFDLRDEPLLVAAMEGGAVAYPAGSIAAAERIFIGDAQGRIWRIDARADDPADWRIAIAWPPADPAALRGWVPGRPVVGRPSVALRPDGRLAVAFATGGDGAAPAHWVSFNDAVALGGAGVGFEVTPNWVMPLAPGEVATDGPTVRDGIAFLTTQTAGAGACGADRLVGRLYGVDFVQRFVDANGQPATFDFDGRRLDVVPALPRFEDGARASAGLAIVLPPGRTAAGLALTRTPACDDRAAQDSVILSLAGEGAPVAVGDAPNGLQIERIQDGRVVRQPFDADLLARHRAGLLDLCLTCIPGDDVGAAPLQGSQLPFPSRLLYWGSTLLD